MSNGCTVSPHLLHDDFAGHLRVNRAEIRISSRLAEREGKLFVRIEHFGFEDAVRTDDCVWNIVAIGPRYRCTNRNRQRVRTEAKVIDLYFACFRLLCRAGEQAILANSNRSYALTYHPTSNCTKHTSPH